MLAVQIRRIVFGGIVSIVCVLQKSAISDIYSRTFPVRRTLFCLGIMIPAQVLACNWFANGSLLSHETDLHCRRLLFVFTMATRKRVILTLDTKVKMIQQHEKGIGPR